MSALGRLVASIVLDSSEFEGGVDKAKLAAANAATSVDRAMRDMERSVAGTMSNVGAALAAGFGLNALKNQFEAFVTFRGELEKISVTTGASVQSLSVLGQAAKLAGTDMGTLEAAMIKMTKGLSASNADTKDTGRALEYLGVSGRDAIGNLRDPGAVMQDIAKKLSTMEDGANKTAIALALWGKAGAQMLPTMRELAENGDLLAKVTQLQALQAHDLEVAWTRLQMAHSASGKTIMGELVPPMTALFQVMTQAISGSDSLNASLKRLSASGELSGWAQTAVGGIVTFMQTILVLGANVSYVFKQIGEDLGAMAARAVALATGNIAQFREIRRLSEDDATARRAALDDQEKRIMRMNDLYREQLRVNDLITRAQSGEFGDQASRTAQREAASKAPFRGTDHGTTQIDQYKLLSDELDKHLAKLKGVGELEAFIAKLEEDKYNKLLPWEKQSLINKEAQIVKLEQDKALRAELLKSDAAMMESQQKVLDIQNDYEIALRQQVQDEQFSLDLVGKTTAQAQKMTEMRKLDLDLKRQIAALPQDELGNNVRVTDEMRRQNEEAKKKIGLIIDAKAALQDQVKVWDELATKGGQFFADIVVRGKSAFDALRTELKNFLADLVALVAKKWILNLAASAVGGTTGSALAGQAEQAGANSLVGAATNAAGSYLAYNVFGTAGTVASNAVAVDGIGTVAATGTYTAAGTATASGIYDGITAVLADIPVYGWIALAVLAIAAYFSGKGGGPKTGGSAFGTFDPSTGNMTSGPAAGTQDGRYYTPNQNDAQAAQIVGLIGKGYGSAITSLGGTAGKFGFGIGFDSDPNGTAKDRYSASVTDASGKLIYNTVNASPADGVKLADALSLESSRMVLRALQASDLPAYLTKMLNTVVASSATADQINAVMQGAVALKAVFDIASRNPMKDVMQGIADASNGLALALKNNDTQIRAQMATYDGSAAAAVRLQTATVGYYNAQIQLLAGIQQAKAAIDDMFGATFRNIQLAGLDKQQKYDFYKNEAAQLQQQALASNDPTQIQGLASRINADIQAAFALLSPEEQAAQSGAFLSQGRETQAAIDARLEKITKDAADAVQKTLDDIKTLIGAGAEDQKAAAAKQVTAADTNLAAMQTPKVLIIQTPGGQQVTTF